MIKKNSIFTVVVFLFFTLIANAETIPTGKQLYINKFDLKLNETVITYLYLNGDDFRTLIYNSITRRMNESGILANSNQPPRDAVLIDIDIDYTRHFPGDATPFPVTSLSSPEIYLNIKIFDGEKFYLNYGSGKLVGSIGSFFGNATNKDYYKDMSYSVELTNTIASRINDVLVEKKIAPGTSNVEMEKISTEYIDRLAQQRVAITEQYIPESVADEYINRLKTSDLKSRQTVYKEIFYDWINSKKLFEHIKNDIANRYLTATDSTEIKEIREAMNCLASSGIGEYSAFFEDIKAKATNSDIKDEADDSQKILLKRLMQSKIVHITKDSNPDESWKINQYVRIMKLPDTKSTGLVLKEIYLKHKENKYLQSVFAHILETNAFAQKHEVYNDETLAWACRILGEGGDKQYLLLLQRVASQANSEYLQKYGKKFAAVLAKSK